MSLRVFAALPIPDEIADGIVPELDGLPGAAWQPRENFHITLGFFGDLNEAVIEELDQSLAEIRVSPFELRLQGANHFGRAEPSAIWLGVEPHPGLTDLARRCRRAAQALGVAMPTRSYTPHMTVAYLNAAEIQRVQIFERHFNLYRSDPFLVDRFHLYSSRQRRSGPNAYEVEAVYPLHGPPDAPR